MKLKSTAAGFVAVAIASASAGTLAQDLYPRLGFDTADAIRDHCLAQARRAGHAVAVAVFDHGGDLVSFGRDAGRPAVGAVARWKGLSAAVYLRPTVETGTWNMDTAPMIATAEGGVPLFTRDGVGIGGVGVSGAPSAFDAQCGTLAAEAAGLAVSAGEQ
jgi:uncharacterized protein GlcG (DUF336 family)